MTKPHLITGQKIDPAVLNRAKELRRNMTPAEKRLWGALRGNRLDGFHFRRQQVIGRYIVDFYCHAASLVVEVDGAVHDVQVEYDAERERFLTALGLKVLRFRNKDVIRRLDNVLEQVGTACNEKGDGQEKY